jgi:hypothetical protein
MVPWRETYMPPGRLWSQSNSNCNWKRPYPLDCERNSVRPLVLTQHTSPIDASSDELAHDPAHVHKRCQNRTQLHRCDFRGVLGCQSLESAARQSSTPVLEMSSTYMPHGIPQNTSPMTRVSTFGAKKSMKMKPVIAIRAPIMVLR